MKKGVIISLAALVFAGTLSYLLQAPKNQSELTATNVSEALGHRVADEVAQLMGSNGEIAVLSVEVAPGEEPTLSLLLAAFEESLKSRGGKIAAVKKIPGGLRRLMMGQRFAPKDYEELLDQAPGASVVVSFVGLPNLSLDQLQKLQANYPPLVVVDVLGVVKGAALQDMVKAKAVTLAFVALTPSEIEKEKRQAKLFDRQFKILRAP